MLRNPLRLAISPCPNDTWIFADMLTDPELSDVLEVEFADIADLNARALMRTADLIKVSAAWLPELAQSHRLLRCGGALGYGCGPLLVAASDAALQDGDLVLSPGAGTTAEFLFRRWMGADVRIEHERFDRIMPRIQSGEARAGLIIHESRFTYRQFGLHALCDLGHWWEQSTRSPIPLGVLVADRRLDAAGLADVEDRIRRSLHRARTHPEATLEFCRQYAQEMDPQVMRAHIDLYVNDFSLDIGEAGERALECMLEGSGLCLHDLLERSS